MDCSLEINSSTFEITVFLSLEQVVLEAFGIQLSPSDLIPFLTDTSRKGALTNCVDSDCFEYEQIQRHECYVFLKFNLGPKRR